MAFKKPIKSDRIKALIFSWTFLWCTLLQGQQTKLMLPFGYTGKVYSTSFSPNGKQIVTISIGKTAKFWESKKGNHFFELRGDLSSVNTTCFNPCIFSSSFVRRILVRSEAAIPFTFRKYQLYPVYNIVNKL